MPDNPSFTVISQGYVKDAGGNWIPAVQSAGGAAGAGDASAANQATEIAALSSIDTKLTGPLAVTVGNFPATQPVSLASVPSHPVTGTVGVNNFPATQPVSGSLTVSNFPASQAVTGTFFQPTQPVSAAALPLPAGASSETTLAAMSGKLPATVGQKLMAASMPVTIASDQGPIPTTKQPTGGTNVMKTGTLTTVAVTADQVVLAYTVTALKTFYLTYLVMYGRLTVLAATATILGAISLETPTGTKVITLDDMNPTTSELEFNVIGFPEPIPIAAGTVVRVVVTPAAVTSMLWRANFGGWER